MATRCGATVFALALLIACGGGGSSVPPPPPPPPPTITLVSINTWATSLQVGQSFRFTPVVEGTGKFSTALTWSVNGINGGDSVNGTVTSDGVYTAPPALPPANPVTITATSVQDPTKSGSAALTIFTLAISPTGAKVFYNHTQQFTASVSGITNPTLVWLADHGTVDANGVYSPPLIIAQNATDTVYVNVQNAGSSSVGAAVTLQIPTPTLTSITQNGGSAHEAITLNGQDLIGVQKVFFPGPFGATLSADFQAASTSQVTANVPLGSVTGPLYLTTQPATGVTETSNSINFTRLPNVRFRASKRDLSSGETLQFSHMLLGASSPTGMTWTTDLGTVSTSGLYQAPVVSQESFATVTGCVNSTRSCDSALLRILPLRITPATPVVALGQNLQLDAVEGSSVSANWSVLAGKGSVTSSGLFTAPTDPTQAGAVPVSATAGSLSDVASIGVTGAFPGLVSRTYDYLQFGYDPVTGDYLQKLEGTFVRSLAVNGNRAYALGLGVRFNASQNSTPPSFEIDVYDISDPINPVWLSSAEAVSDAPNLLAAYGRYLFEVDTGRIPGSISNPPSRVALYDVQNNPPTLVSYIDTPDLYWAFTNNGVIYAVPLNPSTGATQPVYAYDITSGTIQQTQYDLVLPSGAIAGATPMQAIGNGALLYADFGTASGGLTLATYDISTSPPTLLSSIPVSGQFLSGFDMLVRGNLLIIGNAILDISGQVPVQVGTAPVQYVEDVQGNLLLGRANLPIIVTDDNDLLVDITDPSKPVIKANVYDYADAVVTPGALIANGKYVLAPEGLGGFATIDLSATGGDVDQARIQGFPDGLIYDHTISGQFMYAAGASNLVGAGGLITFDLTSGTPVLSGTLLYGQKAGFAVQVIGNTAFLGLQDSLRMIDVSNPANPVETGSIPLPTNALVVSGNVLFDGTTDNRLVALNVTSPNSPSVLASVPLPAPAVTMRLNGSTLFVADGSSGLLIFDVSNPAAPVQLSQFSFAKPVWDVAVAGTLAFMAADSSGLVIVDISNLSLPTQISQTTLYSWNPFPFIGDGGPRSVALSITVQNGLVYLGSANALALVFGYDCSQPQYPRLVSMNAFGEYTDSLISGFSFLGNDILVFGDLGVDTGIVQSDASVPRNAINLYYPPLTLRGNTFVVTPATSGKTMTFVHPKFDRNLLGRQHRYPKRKHAYAKIASARN